ncbi:MAG TPA: hypothetical protein VNE38_03765 [Ktedonobacteraceae bacterium]|nr:hypothetical protein [Ktedonobacteraceae bacterium]
MNVGVTPLIARHASSLMLFVRDGGAGDDRRHPYGNDIGFGGQ